MKNKKRTRAGSEAQYGPRLAGKILHNYLENSNAPMARAYREHTAEAQEQGWHPNTELGCDLKTLLRSDKLMKIGKDYQGVMRRDSEGDIDEFYCHDAHYTFVETTRQADRKRNPHVFEGRYITVTRRDDGTPRPNFRPMPTAEGDFTVERYAMGVANELLWALEGLLEK